MLADTSFLIDIMANEPSAVEKVRELEAKGLAIVVGSPSVFELYIGVSLSKKSEEEKKKIVKAISSLAQLSLNYESAAIGGGIYGERWKKRGSPEEDPVDAMLAGISKTHGEPIITRNVKHFSNIDGVRVETY